MAARKVAEDAEKDAIQLENERIDKAMEMPRDELARLRQMLTTKGYSVKARPMLEHV